MNSCVHDEENGILRHSYQTEEKNVEYVYSLKYEYGYLLLFCFWTHLAHIESWLFSSFSIVILITYIAAFNLFLYIYWSWLCLYFPHNLPYHHHDSFLLALLSPLSLYSFKTISIPCTWIIMKYEWKFLKTMDVIMINIITKRQLKRACCFVWRMDLFPEFTIIPTYSSSLPSTKPGIFIFHEKWYDDRERSSWWTWWSDDNHNHHKQHHHHHKISPFFFISPNIRIMVIISTFRSITRFNTKWYFKKMHMHTHRVCIITWIHSRIVYMIAVITAVIKFPSNPLPQKRCINALLQNFSIIIIILTVYRLFCIFSVHLWNFLKD